MISGKYSKLNKICIITLIISTIIGFFNPYEYYATLLWNFWYPFAMFIYFINLKVARRAVKSTILGSETQGYREDYLKLLEGKKMKIFMIGSLCFIKIMSFIEEFWFYSNKRDLGFNFWQNEFLLDNALLMLILATITEIVVVITFSMRIWKEQGEGGVL